MAKTSGVQITPRDRELFESLLRDPKTPDQLLRESVVFRQPFQTKVRLQVRLKQLTDTGFLKRWRYLDSGDGASPFYYKLSREAFRITAGADASPPSKRYFAPISPSLQRHHRTLAECNIQMLVSARQTGVTVSEFRPQDANALTIGNDSLKPDSTWALRSPNGRSYRFYFEIDCSTESLVSSSGRVNTLQQKVLRYEALHYASPSPFRVVFLFTQSRERMQNFLQLTSRIVRNRRRIVFYAARVSDFLQSDLPLHSPVFRDQNDDPSVLIGVPLRKNSQLARSHDEVYSRAPRRQTCAAGPGEGTVLSLPFPER